MRVSELIEKLNKFPPDMEVAELITYYQRNPHRFATEYLGLKLYWYQQILLFFMGESYEIYSDKHLKKNKLSFENNNCKPTKR